MFLYTLLLTISLFLIIPSVLCGDRVAYAAWACDVFLGVHKDVWTVP